MGVSQVRCLATAGGQLLGWEYPGSEAERRLRAEATWFTVSAPSHPGAKNDKCTQQGALVVDGWHSSFSVLENKDSHQGSVGALPCQGPRWKPDNVMVQMVGGGLSGETAGLSWPAVFTPWWLCWAQTACRFWKPGTGGLLGSGTAQLRWCQDFWGWEDPQVRDSVPHLSSLSSLGGSQPHLLPLLHVIGCEPSKKMALEYCFQCFHICDYI